MIFDNKPFYLIDNNGISTLFTAVNSILPIGMRGVIREDDQTNPYLVSDTLEADMYLTKRKIDFEEGFLSQYRYEIENAAETQHISTDLLTAVVMLERINRGGWNYQLLEQMAVSWMSNYLIRRNATLGLAQINILDAQKYFHKAPNLYLKEMLEPTVSIALCAYALRQLLDAYDPWEHVSTDSPFSELYFDEKISDNYKCSLYIASEYICGINNVRKKYVLVYAQYIHSIAPDFYTKYDRSNKHTENSYG